MTFKRNSSLDVLPLRRPSPATDALERPVGRRRAQWHQRLVEAEGGYRLGLRASSILYVHLFALCLIVVSGGVLNLTFVEWLLVGMCAAAVLAAELFNASVQWLTKHPALQSTPESRDASRLSTAATLTTIAAALTLAMCVLGRGAWRIFT